ncbi:D-2-hydroxyacid dehydrogenase [[Clostridium] polysaccharolyticum]|uniref:Phosphoglycerate dehydrogenase n=1 Tax=[Clostridium] polysaccharolyticum TaxID=29364 RepID=A0A1H9ZDK9_9FIRM|nr:D-2-hydroxyacid dehydrogenase [[Clostridium] polysaccharolyticum]SES78933.1 Phosphoglycerate dehydrogenase [[Clostridium] polysaccharolyticum]
MNILITGAWQQALEYTDRLKEKGHEVVFLQYEKDSLPCEYEWVEGIIGNGIFLSHSVEKFTNLRYVQLTSAGYDRVPMDYIKEKGITIHNARGVYSAPMAEYAAAGVLSLYKEQKSFLENQKKHIWDKKRNLKELCGQTVCIVGCGSVGCECAKRFQAFGCNITGVDLYETGYEAFSCMYTMDRLKEALEKADIVVLTLPLTNETRHMMNKSTFASMKAGSVIVNIARGALIKTEDLVEALEEKLFGAVLDVFEEEPLGDSPLWDMEHVIITPHNSFVGSGNNKRMSEVIINNLENV